MQEPMSERAIAYGAFLVFCILSSVRDTVSEILFKNAKLAASPLFVLFIYCVVTQVVAAIFVLRRRTTLFAEAARSANLKSELIFLNIFTLAGFLFYFLAISSPLGAAVSAFVDYGLNPIFTAIVSTFFLQKTLDRNFFWSAAACIVGIVIFGMPP